MRKLATLGTVLFFAVSVIIAPPASAAVKISNGVACTKSGSIKSTSNGKYKCTKNPLSTSKKLTWLSIDCLTMANGYKKAKSMLPAAKIATDNTVANFDADIQNQKLVLETTLAKIELYKGKLANSMAKLAALKADTANLAKNKSNIDSYERAVTSWTSAIASLTKITGPTGDVQRAINRITSFRTTALASYGGIKVDLANSLTTTKLMCSKGL